jgi:hypothetical protein
LWRWYINVITVCLDGIHRSVFVYNMQRYGDWILDITWHKVCLKNQNQTNMCTKKAATEYVGKKRRSRRLNQTPYTGNTRNRPHVSGRSSGQPSLDISPIWTPIIATEVRKRQLCPVQIMCENCVYIVTCQPIVGLRNKMLLGNRPVNKTSAQTRWRHATVLEYGFYATCRGDVTRHRSRGVSRDLRVSASDVTQSSSCETDRATGNSAARTIEGL